MTTPEQRREYQRKWREAHREEISAKQREYRKQYYEEHKEELRAKDRERYYANPEKARAKYEKGKQRSDYKERKAYSMRKRRQEARTRVIQLLGDKCMICGFSDVRALQIDHLIPVKAGGHRRVQSVPIAYYRDMATEIEHGSRDYQLLCANCHCIKTWTNGENNRRME